MEQQPRQEGALYPPCEPHHSGMLAVSPLHSLYYEQCGRRLDPQAVAADAAAGKSPALPVVYVHGGPGGGISPSDRRYFDPEAYAITLLDQRGAGKSTPSACIEENTTWDLVADMERLRVHLGIERWLVFGGSWGSTLALAYAITHPTRVRGLLLRGIFLLRKCEVDWFYQNGASYLFPDYWEGFLAPIPEAERHDLVAAYHRRFLHGTEAEQLRCAQAWSTWECATSKLLVDPEMLHKVDDPKWALAFARIECHYFANRGFFHVEDHLLRHVPILREHGIPCTIVQGRYDVVCPMKSAWALSRAWPEAELLIMDQSGHSAKEAQTTRALVLAADRFCARG